MISILFQLLSLTLDGLTGASQDKMRNEFSTGAHSMMLAVNKWSMLYLGAGKFLEPHAKIPTCAASWYCC